MDMERKNNIVFGNEYWNERYTAGATGWDVGYAAPPIKEYVDQVTDRYTKILIPGCGNSYEAEYLLSKGFADVTLLDISEVLIENLKQKFVGVQSINMIAQDFFDHEGSYDLILEQTFFCALHPSMRLMYAEKAHSLLKNGGKLVGVLFDKEFEKEGPPFGGSAIDYQGIFEKQFQIQKLEKCYNSIAPRSGAEVFINLNKKIQ